MPQSCLVEVNAGASQDTAVRQLLNELLATRGHCRRDLVREDRFRSVALAEVLLAESERFQAECPGDSEELAKLAELIADQRYPGATLERVDKVLLRARCLQGNARRLAGDREAAERQFQRALPALSGPPVSHERAFYCQMLAHLRDDQGRLDEAVALLWRAATIFRELGASKMEGKCLCRLAFLYFQEHDVERASRLFAQARGLLSFKHSPALAAQCHLGLATCLALLGDLDKARELRKQSQPLGDIVADTRELTDIDWLEAKLAGLLGEHDVAVAGLSSVRRRLFKHKRLLDAALCSLDLARLFAKAGQAERIQELIKELHTAFPSSIDQVRSLIALFDFLRCTRTGMDLDSAALAALDLIRRPSAILKKL